MSKDENELDELIQEQIKKWCTTKPVPGSTGNISKEQS